MRVLAASIFVPVLLLGAATAFAKGPCAADVEKFCSGVKKGGGRIAECLKQHDAELSAECKAQHEKRKNEVKGALEACSADAQKFCANVEKGQGRVIHCLKEHEKALEPGCKGELDKHRGGKKQ